jgi:hypothetical protein
MRTSIEVHTRITFQGNRTNALRALVPRLRFDWKRCHGDWPSGEFGSESRDAGPASGEIHSKPCDAGPASSEFHSKSSDAGPASGEFDPESCLFHPMPGDVQGGVTNERLERSRFG